MGVFLLLSYSIGNRTDISSSQVRVRKTGGRKVISLAGSRVVAPTRRIILEASSGRMKRPVSDRRGSGLFYIRAVLLYETL